MTKKSQVGDRPVITDRRPALAEDAARLSAELLDYVTEAHTIDWRPTREALNLPAATPLPKPETRRHITRAPGLLVQLAVLTGQLPAPETGPGGGGTSDGAAPPGAQPAETLAVINTNIARTYMQARTDAGMPPKPTTTAGALHGLVGLLSARRSDGEHALTDDQAARIVQALRHWARTGRIELGWQSPTIAIPGTQCPDCLHIGTLRAPADASGDVRCTSNPVGPNRPGDPYPRRCGAVWPRHTWLQILDRMTAEAS